MADQELNSSPEARNSTIAQITRSRIAVLTILFAVTAALGLPLLWFSPVFTAVEKWVWSVVIILYTLALVAGTVAIVWWSWSQIRGATF